MNKHDALEQAFKNGYERGLKDAQKPFRLWIKDLSDGTVREYGTSCHDALIITDGVLKYENLQNGDGSPSGYCFCYEDGTTDGIGYDYDSYIHIGLI